jgi:hypothetical protein
MPSRPIGRSHRSRGSSRARPAGPQRAAARELGAATPDELRDLVRETALRASWPSAEERLAHRQLQTDDEFFGRWPVPDATGVRCARERRWRRPTSGRSPYRRNASERPGRGERPLAQAGANNAALAPTEAPPPADCWSSARTWGRKGGR